MSDPVRAYLAVAVVGGVASSVTAAVLLLGQVLRPRRAGPGDPHRSA